jgi:hypothetical protein
MIAEAELQEYLDEIRQEVCHRCVERPFGGPPCGPLGKPCGVELHLPQLIEAVHQVHSPLIAPYQEANRGKICTTCPFHLHSDFCPCPMDSLAVLVVQAIEAVDQRREARTQAQRLVAGLPGHDRPDMAEVTRLYEEAAGTWGSCDWPTSFGSAGLNLEGWTADEAEARAVEAGPHDRQVWEEAARWLEEVERRAHEAEAEAVLALESAGAGRWQEAAKHAARAWSLEFATGRPFRRQPATWQGFAQVLAAAAQAHPEPGATAASRYGIALLEASTET